MEIYATADAQLVSFGFLLTFWLQGHDWAINLWEGAVHVAKIARLINEIQRQFMICDDI